MPVDVLEREVALSSEDVCLQLCHAFRVEASVDQMFCYVTPVAGLLVPVSLRGFPKPVAVDRGAKELARSALVDEWKCLLRSVMSARGGL